MLIVKTEVKPSPIHGLGCFAAQKIPKGEVVWEFHPEVDRRYTMQEALRLPQVAQDHFKTYAWQNPHDGAVLYSGDHSKFFNHSDSPNTLMSPDGYHCVAAREIVPGEELTSDYSQLPSLGSVLTIDT